MLAHIYYMRGNYPEAEPIFRRAYKLAIQSENYMGATSALGGMVSIASQKGKLRWVAEMAQQALDRFGQTPASIVPHFCLSTKHYEWNDLDVADGHIQQAIEVGKLIGTPQARVQIHRFLARVRLAQGDHNGFVKALERADVLANEIPSQTTTHADLAAYHILYAIAQSDLATAEEWSNKLAKYADALSHEYQHFPLRLLIAQGKKPEAVEKLQILYDEAVKSGMQGLMIEYRVYQALAAENEASAFAYLSEALTAAEPEGYIRTFVDEGKLLAPLLEKAISRKIAPEYAGRLLRIIEEEQIRKQGRRRKPTGIIPEPLSERELEVLPLLAAGLSNRQIAERLVISVGTAKTHVHNIMQKLEVTGRTKAVARARELKLL
jgi:LuxR family maltose regulon positive regulatory protein